MGWIRAGSVLGLVLTAGLGTPAAAQIDYRNIDDDRPTLLEDAYPVEFRAFEVLAPYRFEAEPGPGHAHVFEPEIEYGLFRNFQAGLKFPFAGVREAAGAQTDTKWGLAGIHTFGMYNFFSEGRWLPALSLRTDIIFPVGSLAGDATRVALKGIATRTWGFNRIHVNVARGFGSEGGLAAVEGSPRWLYGLAYDRTLFRQNLLAIVEIYGRQETAGVRTEYNAGVGVRYQLSPTTVVDLGVSRRLRDDVGPDFAVTAGLSYVFAIPGLIPLPRH
jgi:hypothetical protein